MDNKNLLMTIEELSIALAQEKVAKNALKVENERLNQLLKENEDESEITE